MIERKSHEGAAESYRGLLEYTCRFLERRRIDEEEAAAAAAAEAAFERDPPAAEPKHKLPQPQPPLPDDVLSGAATAEIAREGRRELGVMGHGADVTAAGSTVRFAWLALGLFILVTGTVRHAAQFLRWRELRCLARH
jgi:hypothetical protein